MDLCSVVVQHSTCGRMRACAYVNKRIQVPVSVLRSFLWACVCTRGSSALRGGGGVRGWLAHCVRMCDHAIGVLHERVRERFVVPTLEFGRLQKTRTTRQDVNNGQRYGN